MNAETYLWIKAAHVISVIAWMAGLLYLPRLFVYHAKAEPGGELSETLKVMERRLAWAIMTPAAVAAWIFGGIMVIVGGLWEEPWFQLKFVLALLLTGTHHALMRYQAKFAQDLAPHSSRFFRIVNEIPTLLMIGIVLLVVVKPF